MVVPVDRNMMLTPDEYMALMRLLRSDSFSEGNVNSETMTAPPSPPQKRKSRRKNPKLKRAVTEANRQLRTKSGKLRKGKTQADVMRLAHRLMKRM